MKLALDAPVYVAGHNGMVGSAIVRKLQSLGYKNLFFQRHKELDLTRQADVERYFAAHRFEQVIVAAAKVGGIHANNTQPADFIYQNLMIEANIIHAAFTHGVKRLLFLGSSCIYPRLAPQPMTEDSLLTGKLEPTNEPYAIAKIAGIKLCESYNRQHGVDYRSVMPTNLYGPFDNFDLQSSHVIPALMRKIHEAKIRNKPSVEVWGTGSPRREFLHVEDMADASLFVMQLEKEIYAEQTTPTLSHINVGYGEDLSIKDLVNLMVKVVGYNGQIEWNTKMPDGTPRKLMDVSRLKNLGWSAKIDLEVGLRDTYEWFLQNI